MREVRKLLALIGLLGLGLEVQAFAYTPLPENPSAFSNCTAKVKVSAARLRSGPSLDASIKGLRLQDESIYVTRVQGKWVQVITSNGPTSDTGYMAAYLLTFPYHELLEQWKRETPSPSVGKKAKVKWAALNLRKYPSKEAPRLGGFARGDEVAVLSDLGNGWSLVESRSEEGNPGCYGFVANRALASPDVPDPPDWSAPLAKVRRLPGQHLEPTQESPGEYLARTAWSPGVFIAEYKARQGLLGPGELLATLH